MYHSSLSSNCFEHLGFSWVCLLWIMWILVWLVVVVVVVVLYVFDLKITTQWCLGLTLASLFRDPSWLYSGNLMQCQGPNPVSCIQGLNPCAMYPAPSECFWSLVEEIILSISLGPGKALKNWSLWNKSLGTGANGWIVSSQALGQIHYLWEFIDYLLA